MKGQDKYGYYYNKKTYQQPVQQPYSSKAESSDYARQPDYQQSKDTTNYAKRRPQTYAQSNRNNTAANDDMYKYEHDYDQYYKEDYYGYNQEYYDYGEEYYDYGVEYSKPAPKQDLQITKANSDYYYDRPQKKRDEAQEAMSKGKQQRADARNYKSKEQTSYNDDQYELFPRKAYSVQQPISNNVARGQKTEYNDKYFYAKGRTDQSDFQQIRGSEKQEDDDLTPSHRQVHNTPTYDAGQYDQRPIRGSRRPRGSARGGASREAPTECYHEGQGDRQRDGPDGPQRETSTREVKRGGARVQNKNKIQRENQNNQTEATDAFFDEGDIKGEVQYHPRTTRASRGRGRGAHDQAGTRQSNRPAMEAAKPEPNKEHQQLIYQAKKPSQDKAEQQSTQPNQIQHDYWNQNQYQAKGPSQEQKFNDSDDQIQLQDIINSLDDSDGGETAQQVMQPPTVQFSYLNLDEQKNNAIIESVLSNVDEDFSNRFRPNAPNQQTRALYEHLMQQQPTQYEYNAEGLFPTASIIQPKPQQDLTSMLQPGSFPIEVSDYKKAAVQEMTRKKEAVIAKNKSYNLANMDPSMIKDPALTIQLAIKQQQLQMQQQYMQQQNPDQQQQDHLGQAKFIGNQLFYNNLPVLGNDLLLAQRLAQQQMLLQQMQFYQQFNKDAHGPASPGKREAQNGQGDEDDYYVPGYQFTQRYEQAFRPRSDDWQQMQSSNQQAQEEANYGYQDYAFNQAYVPSHEMQQHMPPEQSFNHMMMQSMMYPSHTIESNLNLSAQPFVPSASVAQQAAGVEEQPKFSKFMSPSGMERQEQSIYHHELRDHYSDSKQSSEGRLPRQLDMSHPSLQQYSMNNPHHDFNQGYPGDKGNDSYQMGM